MSDPIQDAPVKPTEDFEDLYDSAPCGYLSLSADGRIAHANQRIADWTGYAKADLIGRRFHDLLNAPGRIFYETNVSPLLRMQGSIDEVAMDFMASDRSKVPGLVNAAERRNDAGELLFTRFTVFRAIERRRYERALVDAKAATEQAVAAEREMSQLREQFIAVLGHDLRNPLASISSGIRLLTSREPVSAKGLHILTLMQGSIVRASDLIDNVLDFARGRLGGGITLARDATAPLTPVLQQVVSELVSVSPEGDIRSEIRVREPVNCDRVRIGQLLSNLLGNAIAHGAKGEPIRVEAYTSENELVISVANGGDAIDQTKLERLFQPFVRGDLGTGQAGLGLGLHIASEIAKAHGGELAVTSNPNETRFTFTMPLALVAQT